eukprot:COSAG04_NODE_2507_length_3994_cov_3.489859_1_plen_128_part_10
MWQSEGGASPPRPPFPPCSALSTTPSTLGRSRYSRNSAPCSHDYGADYGAEAWKNATQMISAILLRIVYLVEERVDDVPIHQESVGGDHSFGGRFRPLRNRPPVFWCHFLESWRQDGENREKTRKNGA